LKFNKKGSVGSNLDELSILGDQKTSQQRPRITFQYTPPKNIPLKYGRLSNNLDENLAHGLGNKQFTRSQIRRSGDHRSPEGVKIGEVGGVNKLGEVKLPASETVFQQNLNEALKRISKLQKQDLQAEDDTKHLLVEAKGRSALSMARKNSRENSSYKLLGSRGGESFKVLVTSKHLIDGTAIQEEEEEQPRRKTTGTQLRNSLRKTTSSNDFGNSLFKLGFVMAITKATLFDPDNRESPLKESLPPTHVFRGHMLGSSQQHWSTVDVVRDAGRRSEPADNFTESANMKVLRMLTAARREGELESLLPILPKKYQAQFHGMHDPMKSFQRRRMGSEDVETILKNATKKRIANSFFDFNSSKDKTDIVINANDNEVTLNKSDLFYLNAEISHQQNVSGMLKTVRKASVLPPPAFVDEPESEMHVMLPRPGPKPERSSRVIKQEDKSKVNPSKKEEEGGKKSGGEELKKPAEDASKTAAKLDKKTKRKSEVKRNSAGNKSQILIKKKEKTEEKSSEPKPDLLKASDKVKTSKSNASNSSQKKKRKSVLDASEKPEAKASKSDIKGEELKAADRVVSDIAYVPEMQYNIKLTPGAELIVEENIFIADFGGKNSDSKLVAADAVAKVSKTSFSMTHRPDEIKSGKTPSKNTMKRSSNLEQKPEVSLKKEVENFRKSKVAGEDKSKKVNQEVTDEVKYVEPEAQEKQDYLKKSDKNNYQMKTNDRKSTGKKSTFERKSTSERKSTNERKATVERKSIPYRKSIPNRISNSSKDSDRVYRKKDEINANLKVKDDVKKIRSNQMEMVKPKQEEEPPVVKVTSSKSVASSRLNGVNSKESNSFVNVIAYQPSTSKMKIEEAEKVSQKSKPAQVVCSNQSVQKVVPTVQSHSENLPTIKEKTPKQAVVEEEPKKLVREKTRRATVPARSKPSLFDPSEAKPPKWVEKVPEFTEQYTWSYFQHPPITKPRRHSVGSFTPTGTFRPPSKQSRLILPTLVKDNSLNFSGVFKDYNQKHRRSRNVLMKFLEAL